MKIEILLAAVLFGIIPFNAHAVDSDIVVTNAWVQAMPPSQNTSAAYMTLSNTTSKEIVLASASCTMAGATEIHMMSQTNSMMRMAMVSSITIPPRGTVTLKPGGFHLMLINLKKPLNQGDMVPLTLNFQNGSSVSVSAMVKLQDDQSSGMQGMKM